MTRPWSKRAAELFETEGPYADFAAWQEWISHRDKDGVLQDVPLVFIAWMYAAMCELCDREPPLQNIICELLDRTFPPGEPNGWLLLKWKKDAVVVFKGLL